MKWLVLRTRLPPTVAPATWSQDVSPKNTYRRPIPQRAINPRRCNISCDANALDGDGTTNDQLVERFLKLVHSGVINVVVIGGVRDEIQHRQTPWNVTAVFFPRIFNLRPGLNHPAKMRTPDSCCLDLDQNSLRTGFDKR